MAREGGTDGRTDGRRDGGRDAENGFAPLGHGARRRDRGARTGRDRETEQGKAGGCVMASWKGL